MSLVSHFNSLASIAAFAEGSGSTNQESSAFGFCTQTKWVRMCQRQLLDTNGVYVECYFVMWSSPFRPKCFDRAPWLAPCVSQYETTRFNPESSTTNRKSNQHRRCVMPIKLLGFTIIMLSMASISHRGLTLNAIEHLALGISLYCLGHKLS